MKNLGRFLFDKALAGNKETFLKFLKGSLEPKNLKASTAGMKKSLIWQVQRLALKLTTHLLSIPASLYTGQLPRRSEDRFKELKSYFIYIPIV